MDFPNRAMERVRLSHGTLQKHTMAKNVTELQSMIFEDITSNTQLQTLTMSQFDHVVVQLETATSIRSNIEYSKSEETVSPEFDWRCWNSKLASLPIVITHFLTITVLRISHSFLKHVFAFQGTCK